MSDSKREGLRGSLGQCLLSVYRGTEKLNKDMILSLLNGEVRRSILDCGCGDGSFTLDLGARTAAKTLHGIELDATRAQAAKLRGIHVIGTDLNDKFPHADASFDLVHSNQVIEHLVQTDRFLKETRRVLKPDGIAILSTNNLSSWHNIISLAFGMQPPPMHVSGEVIAGNPLDPLRGTQHPTRGDSHLRLFSYRGLREVCDYHGFRILEYLSVGYYPLPPRLSKWATRIDPWHGAFLIAKMQKR